MKAQDNRLIDEESDDDEAEALSLCDLPIEGRENCETYEISGLSFEFGDFEFDSSVDREPLLIRTADEIFFEGQILPLRPSMSSKSNSLNESLNSLQSSRSGSLSESANSASQNDSCGFSSRSNCVRAYNLETSSAQRQRMGSQRRRSSARPSGWGLFQRGLVRTPEIDMRDIRLRRRTSTRSAGSCGRTSTRSSGSVSVKALESKGGKGLGLERIFLICKCSSDAVETVDSKIVITKSVKENGGKACAKQAMSQQKLSVSEAPLV